MGIVIQFQFACKGYDIKNPLGKNDRVSLIRTDGVVVVEQFREIVVRGVTVTQYFVFPVMFRFPVVYVYFFFDQVWRAT